MEALAGGAAVIDGSMDDISAVKTWHGVILQYKVSQKCQEELARLGAKGDPSERETAAQKRALAISKAVTALAHLHHKDTRAKLQALMAYERGDRAAMAITHSTELLNNNDPLYWYSCFVRNFPRGDCREMGPRVSMLPSWSSLSAC